MSRANTHRHSDIRALVSLLEPLVKLWRTRLCWYYDDLGLGRISVGIVWDQPLIERFSALAHGEHFKEWPVSFERLVVQPSTKNCLRANPINWSNVLRKHTRHLDHAIYRRNQF